MNAFFQKIVAFFMAVGAFFSGLFWWNKKPAEPEPEPSAVTEPATEPTAEPPILTSIPDGVSSGKQGAHHVQGIAVDEENGYIYFAFTTHLLKTDLQGNPVGSVTGLQGHLGCITFNPADGNIYGSLEYKHDEIGQGITGDEIEDGFYIAVFNGAAITRENMSPETDGVLRGAYLPEVLADYSGTGTDINGESVPHKYGCGGVDAICFAPAPGQPSGEKYLYVACGVYSDVNRTDNDHMILYRYRIDAVRDAALPLTQSAMHKNSPGAPESKYFVYTGNTSYGVQNMEYDAASCVLLLFVYYGSKTAFPNYDVYPVDLSRPAQTAALTGLDETGEALALFGASTPESNEITGWHFPHGQYGVHAKRDGGFYIAEPVVQDGEQTAVIYSYQFDPAIGFIK